MGCDASLLSCFAFSSRTSSTGEGEDTAAFECEFGCLQGVSVITVSETGQRGEGESDEGTGEVVGEAGAAKRDPQLLFFAPTAVGSPVVGEDNAACETEFGCQRGVFFAPPDVDTVEVEGGTRVRGRMGVRMRMVNEGRL